MIGDDDIEDWDEIEEVDLSKKRYLSDEGREKISRNNQRMFKDPEYRKKWSKQSKDLWKDPEYRKKTIEGIKRTRDGKKQSEINKERWKNPEYAKKISETFRKKRLKNIDKQLKIMRKNSLTIRTKSDSVWNKDRDKIFFDLLKEGMSFPNMSKKMGINESSVRNRFYRLQNIQKK